MSTETHPIEAHPIEAGTRYGFFTDTSVCIGCKACEVACKEWNGIASEVAAMTGNSYDNTGSLDATSWRHVAFIEKSKRVAPAAVVGAPGVARDLVWLMSSDVCKHCTEAACLDVCPTGSLVRTEFGSVVVQPDICNGCGYCVPACPFGVIGKNEQDGRAGKCTLCYDRLKGGDQPACAQACPTQSIQFGPVSELRVTAAARLETLTEAGVEEARLYGHDPSDGIGGAGAMFLLLDTPDVYGLPPNPTTTTRDLAAMWRTVGKAAAGLVIGVALVIFGDRS
ncbi:MAG: 4Fe-4S dicluster domain-containing protein [Ilumatobacteraceae bacterium]